MTLSILQTLRKQYPNDNTYRKEVSRLLVELRSERQTKHVKSKVEKYRAELMRVKQIIIAKQELQQATDLEKAKYMSLEEMKSIWKTIPDCVEKLIIGFYLWYPALRSDWCFAKVEGNNFVFNEFLKQGNKNEGSKIKPIVEELKPLLPFMDKVSSTPAALQQRLLKATFKYFEKKIGVNQFRKIWVFDNKDLSMAKRKELSKEMNHSFEVSMLYYQKNDLNE